ncbi:MAG TPA: POTRA domain-containing protein, partial [Terriglobales bacterium]|nr:POTRA domain-containing protein [Terriglobales bacterium]
MKPQGPCPFGGPGLETSNGSVGQLNRGAALDRARERRGGVVSLLTALVAAVVLCGTGVAQEPTQAPPAANPATQQAPAQPAAQEPAAPPASVPATTLQEPAQPQLQPPAAEPAAPAPQPQGEPQTQAQPAANAHDLISQIVIHGNRRIPAETIRARIFTRPGDVYDAASLDRDFSSLWNTGYFDDLRFEREESTKGWIIHVYVTEKPTIREIKYEGLNSVSQSDVLDRFKERKVSLTQESQYDPTKVKRAEVVIKELLAEHGRQFATIRTEVRRIPPAAVSVTFVVKEGPKVKVGNIKFEGNKNLKSRYLRAAMKNLRPIGIPHSIFLENLFSKTY